MDPVIKTEALTKIFNQKTIAVNDLYLDVPPNSIFGFLGPNGSGKTTTIKLILGLLRPSAGSVRVFNTPMGMDSAALRQKIGYLPTQPVFPDKMTPITYLDFVGKIFGIPKNIRIPRITELIRSVDFVGRSSTAKLITELGSREGKTIFVSSHILADIDRFCTHISIINNGKLVFNGTISEVKQLIRTNTVNLHVEGDATSFATQLREIPHVVDVDYTRHNVKVGIDDSKHYATALLAVFRILCKEDIELLAINSGSETLEEAFLSLLEEEKSYGFLRAISRKA